ncbi:MAG: fatty acid desaturase [Pseudomonadota bacterium]
MTVHADYSLPSKLNQALIGLLLALGIAGMWLGLHFYSMFVFDLTWSTLLQALVMSALLCWLSVGVFIISHDAMHGTLAPGHPAINERIGAILIFLYAGFGWKKMRDAHFAHHKLSGRPGDPDFDEDNPTSFWRWYATFFRRYFGWQSLLWVHSVVALYWLVFDVPFLQIFVLYGAPALMSSLQLFYFGTYRPHRHNAAAFEDHHNTRSDHFRTLTSLASCFHFGYHLEHHRRPDVPWWALPGAKKAGVGLSAEEREAKGKSSPHELA